MKLLTGFLRVAVLTLCLATGVGAQTSQIVMASTTSTEQSGLFGQLLPAFKAASGVEVKVVALGTGQALDMGRRGDADIVFVHDQAAEEITLRIHEPIGGRAGHPALPIRERCTDPLAEETVVGLDAVAVQKADHDLGAGVVETRSEKPLPVVLDLYQVAIGDGSGQPEDGVRVDPGMAGDDAVGLTRLENDGD